MSTMQYQPQAQPQHSTQYQQHVMPAYGQPIRLPMLPERLHRLILGIGISLITLGVICIIFGGISYVIFRPNLVLYIGTNIWVGVFYTIAGSLTTVYYRQRINEQLTHAAYAFSIIGFIFSLPHLGLSIASLFYYYVASAIVSLSLAITGLSATLACVIIFSKHVYCVQGGATMQYQVFGNVAVGSPPQPAGTAYVATQQLPVQANPNYYQQMQAGNPMIYPGGNAMPSTAITAPQTTNDTIPDGQTDLPAKHN